MSLLDKIKFDEAFMEHYVSGTFDICDVRSGKSKVYKTGEIVLTSYYPVIYALRELNYFEDLTQKEIEFIKTKAEKIIQKDGLIKRINELQKKVELLESEIAL